MEMTASAVPCADVADFQRVPSQDPAPLQSGWEEDSDFFSSHDSFGSLDEEYVRPLLNGVCSSCFWKSLPEQYFYKINYWQDVNCLQYLVVKHQIWSMGVLANVPPPS